MTFASALWYLRNGQIVGERIQKIHNDVINAYYLDSDSFTLYMWRTNSTECREALRKYRKDEWIQIIRGMQTNEIFTKSKPVFPSNIAIGNEWFPIEELTSPKRQMGNQRRQMYSDFHKSLEDGFYLDQILHEATLNRKSYLISRRFICHKRDDSLIYKRNVLIQHAETRATPFLAIYTINSSGKKIPYRISVRDILFQWKFQNESTRR